MAGKISIYSAAGEKTGKTIELPVQFSESMRTDVVKRAVLAAQNNRRQGYGPDSESGQRSSARYKGTRKGWGHSYSYGRARLPRLMIKKGGRRAGQTKIVPQAVGGRSVHAPMPHANYSNAINRKERRLAIRTAISATALVEFVRARGHRVPEGAQLPFVVEESAEHLGKTREFEKLFEALGLADELARGKIKQARPGKGKMRGRPYKRRKSLLFVTAGKIPAGASNLPGVDVVSVNKLNAELLAPGGVVGRLTVWTAAAINKLKEEKLYV
ncbi:MAG: 50S ribosomal protein L4 [archaeon]